MKFRIPKWSGLNYTDYKEIEEAYLRVWRIGGNLSPRAKWIGLKKEGGSDER